MLKITILLSMITHLVFLWWLPTEIAPKKTKIKDVKVKLVKKTPKPLPTPTPTPILTPVISPKPSPPKTKPPKSPKKIIRKKKKVPTRRKPKNKPLKNAKAIQGLTKESLAPKDTKTKKNISAPAGNTMMIPDTGIRVNPNDVQELEQNLEADAILIRSSIRTPELTDAAIDSGIEGQFRIEVFVDEGGNVVNTEQDRKVGYEMDVLLIQAAKKARFIPRKNKKGQAISGWSYILFSLVQPF